MLTTHSAAKRRRTWHGRLRQALKGGSPSTPRQAECATGVSALPACCAFGHCVPLLHRPSVTAPDVSNEADGCNPRATRSSHVRPSWMPATPPCSIIAGLDSCVSIVPGPVNSLCRVDVGHDECSCQGVRFLMLRIRPVSTRCIRRTGHAWCRHAARLQRTSLVPMNQQFEQTLSSKRDSGQA